MSSWQGTRHESVGLAEGFYDARVWEAQDFERMRLYIHDNPVKRRLVTEATEYPYSSAHGGFELDPAPQGLKPTLAGTSYGTAEAMP